MTPPDSNPVPPGHKDAGYVRKMLAQDHHIFQGEFPSTPENVAGVVDQLMAYPGCYDPGSDSFKLDKMAEWIMTRLEGYRQACVAGKAPAPVAPAPAPPRPSSRRMPARPVARPQTVARPQSRKLAKPPEPKEEPVAPPPPPPPVEPEVKEEPVAPPPSPPEPLPAPPAPREPDTERIEARADSQEKTDRITPDMEQPVTGRTSTAPPPMPVTEKPKPASPPITGRVMSAPPPRRVGEPKPASVPEPVKEVPPEPKVTDDAWSKLAESLGVKATGSDVVDAVIAEVAHLVSQVEMGRGEGGDAAAERDLLWDVLGDLVRDVAVIMADLEANQAAMERIIQDRARRRPSGGSW